MKKFEAIELKNIDIEWLHDKKEAPAMQGMAINKLRQEYKGSKKFGYMLLGGREGLLEQGCYYLLQLKYNNEDGSEPSHALIAFKENGSDITGSAIFKNSDKYFDLIKSDIVSDKNRSSCCDYEMTDSGQCMICGCKAEKIGEYLEKKKMAFCWLENGQFITREDCEKSGYKFNNN